ncbi:MAG: isoprenylcysteine carboxylmethyltransferase family protein [Vicinamibacterales bacterium]
MVLVAEFVVLLPLMAYHRLKARTNEKLDRRQEGIFILATLRPIALVFFVGAITYLVNPVRMAWSSVPLPMWLRWVGPGVVLSSWILLFWALRGLGPNLTDTVVTRRAHTLVTSGPYRFVRHPFYDSVALLLLGIALTAANWFLLLTGGLVFALLTIRSRVEEANLLARFGEPYRAYRSRTGRFLPKIARQP